MCPTGTSLHPASITGDSKSDFRRAFEVIDFDHDGKISGEDLRSFYTTISSSGDDEEMINAMMAVADANKDGYVEYEEFEKVLKERKEKGKKEEEKSYGDGAVMEEVFKVMDKDGDGILGVNDLKDYLRLAGIDVGNDEIKAMIKLGCGDDSNGVSFHGFVNIFSSL